MAIREILTVADHAAILKQVSEPVARVDDDLRALMDDMLETMYDAPGIGLAAIQVGVAKRVIVMDLAREGEDKQPRYFVNPEILWRSEDTLPYEEGCLSIPEIYDEVDRPARVRVRYLNYQGEQVEEEAEGVEEEEETALYQKGIALFPVPVGIVRGVQGGGRSPVDPGAWRKGAVKEEAPFPQGPCDMKPAPVPGIFVFQDGEGEDDVLIFHGPALRSFNGMKLTGKDGHDAAGMDRIGHKVHENGPPSFFDIDQLHLVVPVGGHPGKVPGDGAEIGIVGKARLFMEPGLLILGIFDQFHGKVFLSGGGRGRRFFAFTRISFLY